MARDDTIEVKITSPREIVWQGRAAAVSSENSQGPFDILPDHANFVTLVKDTPIVLHFKNNKSEQFSFKRAVVHNENNTVTVYAELGIDNTNEEENKEGTQNTKEDSRQ